MTGLAEELLKRRVYCPSLLLAWRSWRGKVPTKGSAQKEVPTKLPLALPTTANTHQRQPHITTSTTQKETQEHTHRHTKANNTKKPQTKRDLRWSFLFSCGERARLRCVCVVCLFVCVFVCLFVCLLFFFFFVKHLALWPDTLDSLLTRISAQVTCWRFVCFVFGIRKY